MRYLLTILFSSAVFLLMAFNGPDKPTRSIATPAQAFKMDCAPATAQTDLDINNVRARLLVGGDFGWDGTNARYVVPNLGPDEPQVSSIFAGALWMGGIDPTGNLKVAAQQYGTATGDADFWPGPLTEVGFVDAETCTNWDRFFTVTGDDIDLHVAQFQTAQTLGIAYDEELIPNSIKEWPAIGNPFFFERVGFELPSASQGLAPFFDVSGTGTYSPLDGDYPILEIRGCPEPEYADQMTFWIFNDAGNVHTESGGEALQMEIQALSFAFASNDELNDMTFSRYKLINRAVESLDSTYFGFWLDPQLGCGADDYVGCDTLRDLMYVYNSDAIDGNIGSECDDGTPTYGDKVPYFGVDLFRGPLSPVSLDGGPGQDTLIELGMNSFIYYMSTPGTGEDPNLIGPRTPQEYYNLLTGFFRTGLPITVGGSGTVGTVETKFAFHDEPTNTNGWSMCTANLPVEDVKTVQASGPFRLDPGQVNELIIGIPWVPDVTYPCPDMGRLFRADDVAQGFFDSCFDKLDGPDAPDMALIPQDQKVIGVLTNDELTSNNSNESYFETDPFIGGELPFPLGSYLFEGYIVYQLVDGTVTQNELRNTDLARIVFQSDIKNEAADIFNWFPVSNPNAGPFDPPFIFVPELQVEGANEGVSISFELTTDIFTNEPLINQTTYYYSVIAYGFNEFVPFDPIDQIGQQTPYIESTQNVQRYSVTVGADPNTVASFGDGAIVTRLDGEGAGSNFLSISDEERNRILDAQEGLSGYEGTIEYQEGAGPIGVKVVDPLNIVEGDYVLRFDQSTAIATGQSAWELFDAQTDQSLGRATQSLENINERFFPDLGFSVTLGQTPDAGDLADDGNGAIGQTITYADPANAWLTPVRDNATSPEELQPFDTHYLPTAGGELNSDLDPEQAFTNLGTGHFSPYTLMDWRNRAELYATPAWIDPTSELVQNQNPLRDLNNVDVVFTSDKSKWSRCVVVETGNRYFTDEGFELDNNKDNFEVVARPSVSRQDNDGDGRADPDGTGTGFAWFPGYAIDVETGTRVNIFFGENSAFGDNSVGADLQDAVNGSDMMFNPSAQAVLESPSGSDSSFKLILGGMHYIYVTKQPYDECEMINEALNETFSFRKIPAFETITWAGIGLGAPDVPLLSYADGLIPTETVVELRADNPFNLALGIDDNNSFPSYEFSIVNELPNSVFTVPERNEQLDRIVVYPNPSIVSSGVNKGLSNTVKIANLPPESLVTMYSVDGLLVRQFQLDDDSQIGLEASLEWNLKNTAGIPVSSGIYFIHVDAKEIGTRVLKLSVFN